MNGITEYRPSAPKPLIDQLPDELWLRVLLHLPSHALQAASHSCKRLCRLAKDRILGPKVTIVEKTDGIPTVEYATGIEIGYKTGSTLRIVNRETGETEVFQNVRQIEQSSSHSFYESTEYHRKDGLFVICHKTASKKWYDLSELTGVPYHLTSCVSLNHHMFVTIAKSGLIAFWKVNGDGVFQLASKKNTGVPLSLAWQFGENIFLFCSNNEPYELDVEKEEFRSKQLPLAFHKESLSNGRSVFVISNQRLICYDSDLHRQWEMPLSFEYYFHLCNEHWVICKSPLGKYLIFDVHTGKLITTEPIRLNTHALCKNHLISWNNKPNSPLKVFHIPTQTSDIIDLSPYVPSGSSYRICHVRYLKKCVILCLEVEQTFIFIEFTPNKTKDVAYQFLGNKPLRKISNGFLHVGLSRVFNYLNAYDIDNVNLVCRKLHALREEFANSTTIQIDLTNFAGIDFMNANEFGLRNADTLYLASRKSKRNKAFPFCGIRLAKQLNRSFYTSSDCKHRKRMLVLYHVKNEFDCISFSSAIVSCIPLDARRYVCVESKGTITIFEESRKIREISLNCDENPQIEYAARIGNFIAIKGKGFTQKLLDIKTFILHEDANPFNLEKTATNSHSLFTVRNDVLEHFTFPSDGSLNLNRQSSKYPYYAVEAINEKWVLCIHTKFRKNFLLDAKTGNIEIELGDAPQGQELSGDYLVSWNNYNSIVELLHIPTMRQYAMNLLPYLDDKCMYKINEAKLNQNRLIVVLESKSTHTLKRKLSHEEFQIDLYANYLVAWRSEDAIVDLLHIPTRKKYIVDLRADLNDSRAYKIIEATIDQGQLIVTLQSVSTCILEHKISDEKLKNYFSEAVLLE